MTVKNFEIWIQGTWRETKISKLAEGVFKYHIRGLGRVGDLTHIADAFWRHRAADKILESAILIRLRASVISQEVQ